MRAAIIGVGSIAPNHINALLKTGHEIAALCDLIVDRCVAAKERFGLDCPIFTDYREMVRACQPDSVHICLPHYLHAPVACEVLSMGVNVLCEKPLAISEQQLSELESAVRASSARLGVCHQNRYNDTSVAVKKFLEGRTVSTASASLAWSRDAEYYAAAPWRGKWETEGGGVMINQALHTLDLLQWLCGMPSEAVATVSNHSLKDEIEVEDTAFGLFSVSDTTNFIINATNAAHRSLPVHFSLSTTDGKGVDFFGKHLVIDGEYLGTEDTRPEFGKAVYGNGHHRLIEDFYDCLATGRDFPIDFYEARKVVDLILTMYKSNGEKIKIDTHK